MIIEIHGGWTNGFKKDRYEDYFEFSIADFFIVASIPVCLRR